MSRGFRNGLYADFLKCHLLYKMIIFHCRSLPFLKATAACLLGSLLGSLHTE